MGKGKSARRWAKKRGGRPPLPDVPREPNGRPSRRVIHVGERREMNEREAKKVGVEARMRHTGLPVELAGLNQAGMPNGGTVHGVMRLLGIEAENAKRPLGEGMLSAAQWSAAEWWLGRRAQWLRAIDAPGRTTVEEPGVAVDELAGMTEAERNEALRAGWDKLAAEWAAIKACLRDATTEARSSVEAAFEVILVRNCPMPHMVGDLKLGLNALHRRFPRG